MIRISDGANRTMRPQEAQKDCPLRSSLVADPDTESLRDTLHDSGLTGIANEAGGPFQPPTKVINNIRL